MDSVVLSQRGRSPLSINKANVNTFEQHGQRGTKIIFDNGTNVVVTEDVEAVTAAFKAVEGDDDA